MRFYLETKNHLDTEAYPWHQSGTPSIRALKGRNCGCILSSGGAACHLIIHLFCKWTFMSHLFGARDCISLEFLLAKQTKSSCGWIVDIKTSKCRVIEMSYYECLEIIQEECRGWDNCKFWISLKKKISEVISEWSHHENYFTQKTMGRVRESCKVKACVSRQKVQGDCELRRRQVKKG